MFELLVARRYMSSRYGGKWLSMISAFSFLGTTISVAALVISISIMNGFHEEMINRIFASDGHIQVHQPENYAGIISKLENIDGIKKAFPALSDHGIIYHEDDFAGVYKISGIEIDNLVKLLGRDLTESNVQNSTSEVIISSYIANSMRLKLGDAIDVHTMSNMLTIAGNIPKITTLTVSGIFDSLDNNMRTLYVSLDTAMDLFETDFIDIHIFVDNPDSSYDIVHKMNENDISNIFDWHDQNAHFLDTLRVEKNVMFIILSIIVIISAFNICSTLMILVNDKKLCISIMKTMGASDLSIVSIFLICGLSIGLIGTIAGISVGIFLTINIDSIRIFLENCTGVPLLTNTFHFISYLPYKVFYRDIVTIAAISLLSTMISIIPASINALRHDPATVLRYE